MSGRADLQRTARATTGVGGPPGALDRRRTLARVGIRTGEGRSPCGPRTRRCRCPSPMLSLVTAWSVSLTRSRIKRLDRPCVRRANRTGGPRRRSVRANSARRERRHPSNVARMKVMQVGRTMGLAAARAGEQQQRSGSSRAACRCTPANSSRVAHRWLQIQLLGGINCTCMSGQRDGIRGGLTSPAT